MEETLNTILLELQHINKGQQVIIEVQKELTSRIENIEKVQKKVVTATKNINKDHVETITRIQQLKNGMENSAKMKDVLSLGQYEIKELMKQTTLYIAGKMSLSERMIMEIDLLNEREQQEVVNKMNEKIFVRKNNVPADHWDDDQYDDY
ncbi:hypothetical protein RCG19_20955 [Neobacillus sp. OS1-2]|uniref:hypothetical protein n=1 Tax=Neobacillus sp. OS1-2 TaxID=3070680 RepID=UPI0027E0A694|nr:hypothetical protein [Neobacillus sp. OS1-2]WML39615.1 hypothetical protein RCG19_20955 [Neobacillus sp. OS1-2]